MWERRLKEGSRHNRCVEEIKECILYMCEIVKNHSGKTPQLVQMTENYCRQSEHVI